MQDVGGDQDGLAHPAQFLQQFADLDAGPRVEAGRGLVEQQDLGIVQQHPGDREPLLHAPAQAVDLAFGLVDEVGQVEHVLHDGPSGGAVDAVAAREELQVLTDEHVVVGAHEVRHVADDRPDQVVLVADGLAVDAGLAPAGLEQRRENLDRRGLARAVGADEAEALALLDGEVQVVQRHEVAVLPGEVDRLDHRHGWRPDLRRGVLRRWSGRTERDAARGRRPSRARGEAGSTARR